MINKFRNDLKPILKAYIENLPIITAYEVMPYSVEAEFFTVDEYVIKLQILTTNGLETI